MSSTNSFSTSDWEPPSPEHLQSLLPQYEITGILGRGGMGAVYKGRQINLDRNVAIKVLGLNREERDSLPPGGPAGVSAGAAGAKQTFARGEDELNFVARFRQEAQAMARLDHPGIISVYDFGETAEGQLYFVMEFIDGMDIHQYLHHHDGRIPQEHALSILAHVLDALDYAHSHGLIHRDIKPANILLNREGRVKIADFGLAKRFGEGADASIPALTMTDVTLGTPDFVAPEALESGRTVDHRADLYAVGVMLYQLLTGRLPRGQFKAPSEVNEEIDPRLDAIVSKAMQPDPDDRYASAAAVREELDRVLSEPLARVEPGEASAAVAAAVPVTRSVRGAKGGARGKAKSAPNPGLLYGGIGLAAAAAVGILVLAMRDNDSGAEGSTEGSAGFQPVASTEGAGESEQANLAATTPAPSAETIGRMPLPPEAPAAASPARATDDPLRATKDEPFENSLGMQFVPVPGTDVLFCIHEVRYKDYEEYAKRTRETVDGAWRNQTLEGFEIKGGGGDHPVTKVSWEDAQKFCAWLSEKEGRTYRLPTDREWSLAVGIGDQETWETDTTPETVFKVPDSFPWGGEWPPPRGAGNYSDESRRAKAPHDDAKYIDGYDDGFPTTAPVMSFAPNEHGLFDMGGNVWEWCEDWWNSSREQRLLRGGSWNHSERGRLLSSNRARHIPGARGSHHGFRVVVIPSSSAP